MLEFGTPNNLMKLVRTVGALKKEQLLRFFSDADDAVKIEYYLKEYIAARIFDYDELTGIISWHGCSLASDADIKARIHAFWVIVELHSKTVREIWLLPYPNQFLFCTHSGDIYDITVVTQTSDAQLALLRRKQTLFDGVADEVNHIAVVRSEEFGIQLAPYQFDSYCVYDANYRPRYGQWEG